jgi:hypothetical protein
MGQTLCLRTKQEWQIVNTEAPCPECQFKLAPLSILGPKKSAAYIWNPLYCSYAQEKNGGFEKKNIPAENSLSIRIGGGSV